MVSVGGGRRGRSAGFVTTRVAMLGVGASAQGAGPGAPDGRRLHVVDLGTLGGDASNGMALNDLGHVVGESTTAAGETHAFLWRGGHMTDLGTLGGKVSTALAINNHDAVV